MKLKKLLISALAVVMTVATAFSLAGCGGVKAPDEALELPEAAPGMTAAVHDPSVFYDVSSQTYYAFGTHYAVASSKDLVKWSQEASDGQWTTLSGSGS